MPEYFQITSFLYKKIPVLWLKTKNDGSAVLIGLALKKTEKFKLSALADINIDCLQKNFNDYLRDYAPTNLKIETDLVGKNPLKKIQKDLDVSIDVPENFQTLSINKLDLLINEFKISFEKIDASRVDLTLEKKEENKSTLQQPLFSFEKPPFHTTPLIKPLNTEKIYLLFHPIQAIWQFNIEDSNYIYTELDNTTINNISNQILTSIKTSTFTAEEKNSFIKDILNDHSIKDQDSLTRFTIKLEIIKRFFPDCRIFTGNENTHNLKKLIDTVITKKSYVYNTPSKDIFKNTIIQQITKIKSALNNRDKSKKIISMISQPGLYKENEIKEEIKTSISITKELEDAISILRKFLQNRQFNQMVDSQQIAATTYQILQEEIQNLSNTPDREYSLVPSLFNKKRKNEEESTPQNKENKTYEQFFDEIFDPSSLPGSQGN